MAIIGLGQQAQRTHLPCIELARDTGVDVDVVAVADFPAQLAAARDDAAEPLGGATPIAVAPTTPGSFTDTDAARVVEAVIAAGATAVVVATEPLSHFTYVKALEAANVHYLVDKPFLCRPRISVDPAQADATLDDLRWLQDRASAGGGTPRGSVNVTRRFDGALRTVRNALRDAERDTGQAVTHVGALFGDGEHRDAAGCLHQGQHPFHVGYGALNHSGYHVVDTAIWMAGLDTGASPAVVGVTAQSRSVAQYLGGAHDHVGHGARSARDAAAAEYDCVVNVTVERSNGDDTLLSLAILHDSCSNRRWQQPANTEQRLHLGRLSHELTTVTQGEVQNALVRMVELPHADLEDLTPSLPSRIFHADVTRNPLYANTTGRPVYEDLSPPPQARRSLTVSSKFKAVLSFLNKAAGAPYDHEIDVDRHFTSQLTLLLAARSLARGGTLETEKVGHRAPR